MKENRSFGNMKRINLYPYILSASLLVSCSEELLLMNNDVSETLVLEAVTEGSSASRTYLSEIASGTYQAFWSVDDCIGLYADGEESPYPFHLISGEGTSVAQFKGPNRGSHYIAVYPWSIAGKAEGETISVTIPEEQEFVQGSFSSNSYPMVANGDVSGLSFKNLCSILKLSITGKQAVTAIEFLPADSDTFVSGPATVLLSNHDAPRLEMSKEGEDASS